MSMGRRLQQRVLSGLVALAMVASAAPVSTAGAVASEPPRPAKPAFARLDPRGPIPSFGARDAQTDLVNVRWRAGVTARQIQAAEKQFGFSATKTSKLGWAQLDPSGSASAGSLARALRGARLVTEAERPVRMKAFSAAPNDPLFGSQWALRNTGQDGGKAGADVSATQAWAQTTGSHDVIVAIVDQGVNWAHPDLKNNMWLNAAEVPNNKVDDDGNGYVDDVRGWDFRNGDNTVFDLVDGDRHGTHVAGIIGAESDNGTGISGRKPARARDAAQVHRR